MIGLTIDATHTLNNLTESFLTNSRILVLSLSISAILLGLIGSVISAIITIRANDRDTDTIAPYFGIFFCILALLGLGPMFEVSKAYTKYQESPRIDVKSMNTETLTYTVKTSKSGDVISATEPGDKSGTTNVEVLSNSGDSQTVKISKNSIKVVYNSDAKPTLTVEKVTDKGTNKSYYVAQKIVLNNQPIQYK